ncbi:hypothetical protein PPYR_08303 [Photinus pyralis]|uniref:SHSP domain-containing protein n=1 Tax=Photinus pyralis TaxID=7054 RepID=A0A5N4AJ35_PHOPY|nr:alpha-crystallin A chain-like [Photinus pyralis]KAB0797309.1 hypothetical protein PPYR_08303 [Photinus pyralis]
MASYFDQWNQSVVRPSQPVDQRYGVVLESGDLVSPLIIPLNAVYLGKSVSPNYQSSWRSFRYDRRSKVNVNRNQFEINLNVQHFDANELTVKITGNAIIIEGNHDEKHDQHGSVSRQFKRKYLVPNGHNVNKATSVLSGDGILIVSIPRNESVVEERVIPILQGESQDEEQDKRLDEQRSQADEKCEDDQVDEKKA